MYIYTNVYVYVYIKPLHHWISTKYHHYYAKTNQITISQCWCRAFPTSFPGRAVKEKKKKKKRLKSPGNAFDAFCRKRYCMLAITNIIFFMCYIFPIYQFPCNQFKVRQYLLLNILPCKDFNSFRYLLSNTFN